MLTTAPSPSSSGADPTLTYATQPSSAARDHAPRGHKRAGIMHSHHCTATQARPAREGPGCSPDEAATFRRSPRLADTTCAARRKRAVRQRPGPAS